MLLDFMTNPEEVIVSVESVRLSASGGQVAVSGAYTGAPISLPPTLSRDPANPNNFAVQFAWELAKKITKHYRDDLADSSDHELTDAVRQEMKAFAEQEARERERAAQEKKEKTAKEKAAKEKAAKEKERGGKQGGGTGGGGGR
jgi:hypothetical protein